jgi:1-acyl-sn-glycerol-3-phosphate acyltransferase
VNTRYSRSVWRGFEMVFRPWMGRRLDGIHIRGIEDAAWVPGIPLLLVANHVSWWDGFLLREIHRRLRPDAPLHVVMSEAELRRHPIFRCMGAVPLGDSRVAGRRLLEALRSRVEARTNAVIGYFPQGRIWPSHRRPLGFHRGGAWLAERLAPVAIVPVGLHLEPLTRPGPAAFVSVGRPQVTAGPVSPDHLEAAVAGQVDAILRVVREHGEDAARVWSAGSGREDAA